MALVVLGNVIYKEAMIEASKEVSKGVNITKTFKSKNFIFPLIQEPIIVKPMAPVLNMRK